MLPVIYCFHSFIRILPTLLLMIVAIVLLEQDPQAASTSVSAPSPSPPPQTVTLWPLPLLSPFRVLHPQPLRLLLWAVMKMEGMQGTLETSDLVQLRKSNLVQALMAGEKPVFDLPIQVYSRSPFLFRHLWDWITGIIAAFDHGSDPNINLIARKTLSITGCELGDLTRRQNSFVVNCPARVRLIKQLKIRVTEQRLLPRVLLPLVLVHKLMPLMPHSGFRQWASISYVYQLL